MEIVSSRSCWRNWNGQATLNEAKGGSVHYFSGCPRGLVGHPPMPLSPVPPPWSRIHEAEGNWTCLRHAIELLEARLVAKPDELETVIHLGFTLWYEVTEGQLPVDDYARRFLELYRRYADTFSEKADFCHVFGLAIKLDWYFFPGTTEAEGHRLMSQAAALDPMWAQLYEADADLSRLRGRGILAAYYNVK